MTELFIIWLLSLLGKKSSSGSTTARPPAPSVPPATVTPDVVRSTPNLAKRAVVQPDPWPAPAPTSLPPFPGPAWQADTPERPDVMARAVQLLSPLHARGIGQYTIELTGGRWIAYVAKKHGTKKAVEAFRLREDSPAPAPAPAPAPSAKSRPVPVLAVSPVPPAPVSSPAGASPGKVPPTVMRGDSGATVLLAQLLLGMPQSEQDGKFGPKTEAVVRQYQTHNSLKIDGIVGPETWTRLGATS